MSLLDDIVSQCCFFGTKQPSSAIQEEEEQYTKECKLEPFVYRSARQEYIDLELRISGEIRRTVCNAIFGKNEEKVSLATLLCETLLRLPLDVRLPVVQNVVLTGGVSAVSGFARRFYAEVDATLLSPPYNTVLGGLAGKVSISQTALDGPYSSYSGAAIVASMELSSSDLASEGFITRKRLADHGEAAIPDWFSTQYELQEKETRPGFEGSQDTPLGISPIEPRGDWVWREIGWRHLKEGKRTKEKSEQTVPAGRQTSVTVTYGPSQQPTEAKAFVIDFNDEEKSK